MFGGGRASSWRGYAAKGRALDEVERVRHLYRPSVRAGVASREAGRDLCIQIVGPAREMLAQTHTKKKNKTNMSKRATQTITHKRPEGTSSMLEH